MKEKKIVDQRTENCGCQFTKFDDDTENLFACLGHALLNAGEMLKCAGQRWAQIQQASQVARSAQMNRKPHKR